MRYLITGGGGFLGAELAAALADRGDSVSAFDLHAGPRLMALLDEHPGQVSFTAGEIADADAVMAAVEACRPDAIVHGAAVVGVPASIAQPQLTMRVNVEGSLNLFEAMVRHGVRRVVHISSEETYGPFESDIIDETHPQRPLMAYGVSKVAVEQMGRSYALLHGLECINVRTCWVYGPGLPRPRVPKTLVDAAVAGTPLHLPNGGDFLVDHVYVDDLVAGIMGVLDHVDHSFDAYHIATGQAVTLAEIAEIVRGLVPGADLSVGPGTIEFAPGLPAWRKGALDVGRAAQVFGYRPSFDIEAGLAAMVEAARATDGVR